MSSGGRCFKVGNHRGLGRWSCSHPRHHVKHRHAKRLSITPCPPHIVGKALFAPCNSGKASLPARIVRRRGVDQNHLQTAAHQGALRIFCGHVVGKQDFDTPKPRLGRRIEPVKVGELGPEMAQVSGGFH